MSSEKSSSSPDRDEPGRAVSDELLRKASEGPVRHLPDALFGGSAPAAPAVEPAAGGDSPQPERAAEAGGAITDELMRKASGGPVRHLPDLLFGGPSPEPAVLEQDSVVEGVGRSTGGRETEGDTGPPEASGPSDTGSASESSDAGNLSASETSDVVSASVDAEDNDSPGPSNDGVGEVRTVVSTNADAATIDIAPASETPISSGEIGAATVVVLNSDAGSTDSDTVAEPADAVPAESTATDVSESGAGSDDPSAAPDSDAGTTDHDAQAAVGSPAVAAPQGDDNRDAAGDPAPRPVLLIIADSLSYYGPKGGLPADDPRIWPNLVAAELDWDVELVARIGWTCRDGYWALINDPRVWAAVPRAGAVVFATGGMDSLPSPLPTALRELIRYVRPPSLRRVVRDSYNWVQPHLSKLGRPVALPPRVSIDYLEQSRNSLAQLRPELPFVGVLPSVHDCEAYGKVHSGREPAVRALREWSAKTSVPLVDLGEAVRDNIFSGESNPDGIHWGWEGHTAVARAMVKVLQEVSSSR